MTRERERNVSKHELWTLAGETAAKCRELATLIRDGGHADVGAARHCLASLADKLETARGPNPAERIPPRGNAVGGRKSAAKRKDGAR